MEFLDCIRSRAEGRRRGEYRTFEHVRPGLCLIQGDQNIANQAGAGFRSDLNNELQALVTLSSGAAAPGTTYAHEWWADTTSNVLKKRNAANSAWIVIRTLDETFLLSRSSNTILALSDYGKVISATSTFTQTLTAAATLGDGWQVMYRNDGSGIITLDPNSTEQIDNATTINLYPGESCLVICNGANFKTVGRSTGRVEINTQTVSGVAQIDVTAALTANDFDKYEIDLSEIQPSVDGASLFMRISQSATFRAGALDYGWTQGGSSSGAASYANGAPTDTKMQIAGSLSNVSPRNFCATVEFTNPAGTSFAKVFNWRGGYLSSVPTYLSVLGFGLYAGGTSGSATAAIDGVRFLPSSGNLSGRATLYGVRKY